MSASYGMGFVTEEVLIDHMDLDLHKPESVARLEDLRDPAEFALWHEIDERTGSSP
jgi:hypothetical protein